jgi:phosphate butyryltransferase
MISSLDLMVERVRSTGKKHRVAIAWAQDTNTISAVERAVTEGFLEAILIGDTDEIVRTCKSRQVNPEKFTFLRSPDETTSCADAVRLARRGDADIVMKGLVATDKFLKAILDKKEGIMQRESVLSYVCALQLPAYHKLLFLTDPAVIPFPDLNQKAQMVRYAIGMASKFGITNPRIALISASEKKNNIYESSGQYEKLCQLAKDGVFGTCIMDGPLDLFLACDRNSVAIKGINTPVDGDADILVFPSLESGNPFYKGLMLFAGGEIAGMLRGTLKPVVLMSRSESERSKYYCIALSCLMT